MKAGSPPRLVSIVKGEARDRGWVGVSPDTLEQVKEVPLRPQPAKKWVLFCFGFWKFINGC